MIGSRISIHRYGQGPALSHTRKTCKVSASRECLQINYWTAEDPYWCGGSDQRFANYCLISCCIVAFVDSTVKLRGLEGATINSCFRVGVKAWLLVLILPYMMKYLFRAAAHITCILDALRFVATRSQDCILGRTYGQPPNLGMLADGELPDKARVGRCRGARGGRGEQH